ncbi:Cna B-type domain-containing protein [Eubacterium sp. BIOML-A1]|uniref:InlB B-repeat-containing protein n=1 Tax=Eubacterium sp. BIOML-A1 TaxID=2584643 RepID=UPI0012B0F960|nr:InlB B-repeat-containing protein [Eubacterium sp. BIOML-A1]MSC86449.1 Cna B-type domain-containing protein [Eubacterium sp. BIOML-A1]
MKKNANRALSMLLALIMIVGLLPISAFAENDAPTTGTDIAIENMDGKEEDTAKESASPSDPGELPGSDEDKEQGDNKGGEDKTAESNPSPEPASYTLTLKADPAEGGTVEGGGSYDAGTEVTVKATANDGYVFTGWYVEPEEQRDAEERRDEDRRSEDAEYTFTLNADLTLCAVFTQQPQPDEQTPATPTDGEPGENTDEVSGDTGDGAAGGKREAPAGETFTVTFDTNGHGTAPASVTVEDGATITAPKAPEAAGFIFTGWYTEPETKNIWNFGKDTVTGNLTLYAGWEEAPALALRGMSAAPALRDGAKGVKYNINVVKNIPGGEFWLSWINDEMYPKEHKAEVASLVYCHVKEDSGWFFVGAIMEGGGETRPLGRLGAGDKLCVAFHMPAHDVTITPCFVRASNGTGVNGYELNFVYDSSQGAMVRDANNRPRAPEGDGVSVFASPRDGYTVDQVRIWDTSNNREVPIETLWPSGIRGDNMYAFTFQMPKGNVEVRVSFKRLEGWRALSCSVGEHGSVRLIGRNESIKDEGSGPTTLYMAEEPGRHCRLEIIPDSGYELGEVRFTNAAYSSYVQGETTERTYYFDMPDKEAQISVSFVPGSYHRATLTMSGPGNGATLYSKGGTQQIRVNASGATDYKEIQTGTELYVLAGYGGENFVKSITVTRKSGQSFTVEQGESFLMPPEAVTIRVLVAELTAPVILTDSLPEGTVRKAYEVYLESNPPAKPTGFFSVYKPAWEISSGSLPSGLNLDNYSDGIARIKGIPVQAGRYTFTVTASNEKGSGSKQFTLVIKDPTYYDVTVSRMPENGGTVSGAGRYAEDSRVLLSAKPEEGFAFGGWYQGITLLSDQAKDYELTDAIKRAYELEAVFYPLQPFSVALRTADSTMGKVSLTVNGGAAQTGESISQTLYEGSSVSFEAIPETGYAFKEWRGASGLANPHSVSYLDQAYDLTAVFVKPYPLWIGDTQVDSSNLDNILGQTDSQGRPTASYDPATKTLTLHNPTISGAHDRARIYSEDSLTISGELTIGSSDRGVAVYTRGDGALNTLTIAAGSSIAITSDNEAIYAERADVHIKGGTLTAASGYRAVNIKYRGNFIMDGGDVSLSAPNIALIAWKGGSSQTPYSGEHCITVGGGVIRAYSETEDPFLAGDGVISYPANYRAVDAENNVLTLGSNQSSFGVKGTTITIEPKPQLTGFEISFNIVNGTWEGGTAQKTVTLAENSTIQAGDVPKPQPASGYGVGAWDVNPVGQSVTGNATYTWSYFHYKVDYDTQGMGTAPAQTQSINSGSSANGSPDVEWYGSAAEVPMLSGDDRFRVYDAQGLIWFTDPNDDSSAVKPDTPIGGDTTLYCMWVRGDKVVDAVSLSVFPKAGDPIPQNHWYPGGEWGELSAQFVRANGTDYEIGAVNWDPDGDTTFKQGKTYELRVQVSTGDTESSRTFLKGHATVKLDSNYAITNPEVCYALSVDGAASAKIDYVNPTESFVTIKYTVPAPSVSKPVNVTVTGKTASADYDGTEKSVSGFSFTAKDSDDGDVSGVTVTLKSAHADAASIAKTDAGAYGMGLQAEYFDVTLPDGYTLGTVTVKDGKLTIAPADISTATLKIEDLAYNSSGVWPEPTVTWNGITLQKGSDYDVVCGQDVNVGDKTATITGKGNYTGKITAPFKVIPLDASDFEVIIEPETVEYNGQPWTFVAGMADLGQNKISVAVSKYFSSTPLESPRDFDLSWSDSTEPGTVTVTATMKGNYTGSATGTFRIVDPAQPPQGTVEADPASLTFDPAEHGYGTISPKPLTLRNGTSGSVTVKSLDGLTAFEATPLNAAAQPVSLPFTLPAGESMNIAVNPKSGLSAGTHSETLTIAYNDGTDQTLSVALSFTVTGTPPQPTTKHTVTYIVVNGTWADGTTTPKTEEVEDGQSPTQIPTGMLPAENYEGGAWSPDPNGATITGDTTFTYTFDVKNLDVVGIVNWDGDDNQQDKRPEKIMVRLLANNTEHASQEVKAGPSGLWTFRFDNLPASDAQGAIDYTITVDEIPEYTTKVEKVSGTQFVVTNTLNGTVKPKHTVTYNVINGTWADGSNGPKTEEVEDGQSPTQIPTGMIASEGFEGGAWSPNPSGATITDTASFTYTFTAKQNPPGPVTVTGIKLNSNGAKKVYTEGEALDVTGLTLEVSKSDGSKSTVDVTAAMISGFDSSKTGKQTLTVRYEGFTATYEVEVKAKTNPPVTTSTISYNLNGGTLNGKTGTVTIQAENGTTITLPAPTREGYTFDYWEGSRYNAGDSYTVNGDHTFTAQWKKNSTTPGTSDPGKTSPKTGDESNLALWSSLMFLSLAGMLVVAVGTKRRRKTR